MRIGAIAPRMGLEWMHMASQGLSGANADSRAWRRRLKPHNDNLDDDFWPGVSTRYSRENPVPANPDNAAGRVLLEVAMLLSGVGVLIAMVAIFLPGGLTQ
jgi:hypothetical protein